MNLSYNGNEVNKKLLKLELETEKNGLALIEDVKKVILDFNGKVLNKRLATALQKVSPNLYLDRERDYLIIYYTEYNNRSIQVDRRTYYIDDAKHDLTYMYQYQFNEEQPENNFVTRDNRIIAANIIANLEQRVEKRLKIIKETEKQLERIDATLKEYKELSKKIEESKKNFSKDQSYLIERYFDLNFKGV